MVFRAISQAALKSRVARLAWASPCSAIGLALAAIVLLLGGRARRFGGTLEVTLRDSEWLTGRLTRSLRFRAVTLGHVIIAVTRQELDGMRAHERIHVQQYERWGAAFFVAYAASSLWQLVRGRRAYWDNRFEIDARLRSAGGRSVEGISSPR